VDKTVDGKGVDVTDVGSIPTTSTKSTLIGYDVHGNRQFPHDWYYTEQEWNRGVGWGKVPPERIKK